MTTLFDPTLHLFFFFFGGGGAALFFLMHQELFIFKVSILCISTANKWQATALLYF